jgi:hypothetical protein
VALGWGQVRSARLALSRAFGSQPVGDRGNSVESARCLIVPAASIAALSARVCRSDRREVAVGNLVRRAKGLVERPGDGAACGMDVLDRGGAGYVEGISQLASEGPCIEGVEQVDVANPPVDDLQPWLPFREAGERSALVRVETVLERPLNRHDGASGIMVESWFELPNAKSDAASGSNESERSERQ